MPDQEEKALKTVFGIAEEKAILSLVFDQPDFFAVVGRHLDPKFFNNQAAQFVYTIVHHHFHEKNVVLTRELCKDIALRNLTADHDFDEILELIDRPSNPRELPIIRDYLIDWAKDKAYSMLYSSEAINAYESGDYETIDRIINDANKITNISSSGFWFFERVDDLFVEDREERLTSGFGKLDMMLNNGGPTRKETFCWMAPTGVGKSIFLINTGVMNIRRGKNVLHITMELSELKTALRYAGAFTDISIIGRFNEEEKMRLKLKRIKETFGAELVIYEFPPYEINTATIISLIDNLRRTSGIDVDVVIVDYLELMAPMDQNEYLSQRKIATSIRGVASKSNVYLATGTQTNRASMEGAKTEQKVQRGSTTIDLDKTADSFGKMMPFDYIVSLNQTKREYKSDQDLNKPSHLRLYIAKNRNGPKFKVVNATVNYDTMRAVQDEL